MEQARADEVVVGAYFFKLVFRGRELVKQRRVPGIYSLVDFLENILVEVDGEYAKSNECLGFVEEKHAAYVKALLVEVGGSRICCRGFFIG
ncbi:hypothetical protein D3C81_1717170 [compost metagenome]